jgi:outer membrane protein OmpA-like peptidoglycan-associated protein
MSGVRRKLPLALLIIAIAPAASVSAQPPGLVRVVKEPAPIRRWFRAPVTDVLVMVAPGTTLDVLDQERDWYWVVAPPDAHGTRRAGWIRVNQVEAVSSRPVPAPRTPATPQANPSADSAATLESIAEDKVTITTRDATTEADANAATASAHPFEDVHFDRDRYGIRAEDMGPLNAIVAALKADPVLAVNIEGYTCNLGTPAYNLALGVRRANTVRDYLVSQGIAADRLHTVSLGEERPKHDNSHEDTRQLNRRVALVPEAKR